MTIYCGKDTDEQMYGQTNRHRKLDIRKAHFILQTGLAKKKNSTKNFYHKIFYHNLITAD